MKKKVVLKAQDKAVRLYGVNVRVSYPAYKWLNVESKTKGISKNLLIDMIIKKYARI